MTIWVIMEGTKPIVAHYSEESALSWLERLGYEPMGKPEFKMFLKDQQLVTITEVSYYPAPRAPHGIIA